MYGAYFTKFVHNFETGVIVGIIFHISLFERIAQQEKEAGKDFSDPGDFYINALVCDSPIHCTARFPL